MATTRWDLRVLLRAMIVAMLMLGLAWLVTAVTDEGGLSWGQRAGRTLPLTPACAAIAAWVALAPACARGEAVSLAALGRSNAEVVAAAVAGGALVAFAAAFMTGVGTAVDVTAFFPRAARASAWVWQDGAFVDNAQGLRVGSDGAPVRLDRQAAGMALATIPRHGRAAAALATAIAGLALPMLAAHALLAQSMGPSAGGSRQARDKAVAMLVSAGAIAVSVIAFQMATVRSAPALLAAVPSVALLAFAVRRYREPP